MALTVISAFILIIISFCLTTVINPIVEDNSQNSVLSENSEADPRSNYVLDVNEGSGVYSYTVSDNTNTTISEYTLGFSFDSDSGVAKITSFEKITQEDLIVFIVPDKVVNNGIDYNIIDLNGIFKNNNKYLSKVYLSPAVIGLNKQEFQNQIGLRYIDLCKITSMGTGAFQKTSISHIVIPNSVTRLDTQAFAQMGSLTQILFENGSMLSTIPSNCFNACSNLSTLTLPESIREIGSNAFRNSGLSELDLSNLDTSEGAPLLLQEYAFSKMLSNTTITLPGNLEIAGSLSDISLKIILKDTQSLMIRKSSTDSLTFSVTESNFWIDDNFSNWDNLLSKYPSAKLEMLDESNNLMTVVIKENVLLKCLSRERIEIPNTVTSIGASAFKNCFTDTPVSIEIPSGVTSIGSNAFQGCTKLYQLTFAEGSQLQTIGDYAFSGCFVNGTRSSIEIPSSVTSIGSNAFQGCTKLYQLTFAEGSQLQTIGDYAFSGCFVNGTRSSIEIPSSVTSIGYNAFRGCTNLTTVSFAEESQLQTIGDSAFMNCFVEPGTNVETFSNSIVIPSSVISIGSSAFQNSKHLASIAFAEGSQIQTIGTSAFNSQSTIQITIPLDHLITFGTNVVGPRTTVIFTGSLPTATDVETLTINGIQFMVNKNSEDKYELLSALSSLDGAELTIPDTVSSIGFVFKNTNISSISLPSSIIFNDAALSDCKSLTSVSFYGNTQLTIATSVFARCSSLTSVDFGNTTDLKIYAKAFEGCKSLTTITLNSLSILANSAFDQCSSLSDVTITNSSNYTVMNGLVLTKSSGSSNFDRICLRPMNLVNIIIPASVTSLKDVGGEVGLFTNSNIKSVTFESDCSLSIGEKDFYNCTQLEDVVFKPDCNIGLIGNSAFTNTGIYTISIPDSVKSIGVSAFDNCLSLSSVEFGQNSLLAEIGSHAFRGCVKLFEFNITSGVTSIGDDAFWGCATLSKFNITDNQQFYFDGSLLIANNTIIFVVSTASSINISSEITGYSQNAFYNNSIIEFSVSDDHPIFTSVGGILMNKEKTELKIVGGGITELVIPDTVTMLNGSALAYSNLLESVSWNGTSLDISSAAIFNKSNLKNISFTATDSITLDGMSIHECRNIESISLKCNELILTGAAQISNCGYNDLNVTLDCNTLNSASYTGNFFTNCNGLSNLNSSVILPVNSFYGEYSNFNAIIQGEAKNALNVITGCDTSISSDIEGFSQNISSIKVENISVNSNGTILKMRETSFRFSFTTSAGHTVYDVVPIADGVRFEKAGSMYKVIFSDQMPTNLNIVINLVSSGELVTVQFNPLNSGLSVSTIEIVSGTTVLPDMFPTYDIVTDYELVGWYTDPNCTLRYEQSPINSLETLYAKWIPVEGVSISFDNLHGTSNAKYELNDKSLTLATEDRVVPGGIIGLSLKPYDGFELLEWNVSVTYSDGHNNTFSLDSSDLEFTVESSMSSIRIEPVFRYYSNSNSLINVTDIDNSPIRGEDIIQIWNWASEHIDTTMGVWTGFPSIPLIVDDYVYLRSNDDLIKLDIHSGSEIDSITTPSTTVKAYYHYLGYGSGVIIDYATRNAYDLDLNLKYTLNKNYSAVFYNDNYFYGISDSKLWKFNAQTGELSSDSIWSDGVSIAWHSLYGTTSTPVFANNHIYFIEIDGSNRLIASIDLDSGNKSTINLSKLSGLLIDDGWLTYYEYNGSGYLFVTGYNAGLFENKCGNSIISYIQLDSSGGLLSGSERYIEIPDITGTASAFVVYNGRGYINVTDTNSTSKVSAQFYVYDVDGLLSDTTPLIEWNGKVAHSKYLIYQEDSKQSHGSIVLNIAHALEEDGKVYIYLLPYNVEDQAVYIFEDYSGKSSAGQYFVTSKAGSSYGSQAVRVGPNGELVWYTDSGKLYCYGVEELNTYYFMIQTGDGNKWVSVKDSSVSNALNSLDGYSVDAAGMVTLNGKPQVIQYYSNDKWEGPISTIKAFGSYHYFIISDEKADVEQVYYYDSGNTFKTCNVSDVISDKSLLDILLYPELFDIDETYATAGNSVKFSIQIHKLIKNLNDDCAVSVFVKYLNDTTTYVSLPLNVDSSTTITTTSASSEVPCEYLICIWDKVPGYGDAAQLFLKKTGDITTGDGLQ